ncbi:MAG: hypothetical protein VX453_01480 [Acidobacteriota bacterium]|nr:hypothetical protein [Acidobacteriota bacterium]
MKNRDHVVANLGLAVVLLVPSLAAAQSETVPRTPWGDPDLQAVWDYRTVTPLERPEDQANKEFLTEEEAASLEQGILARNARLLTRPAESTSASEQVDRREDGTPGFYNNFWLDRGTTAVGTRRTSLIVEPSDGRLPQLTADAQRLADSPEARRIAEVRRGAQPAQSWTDLDAGDRCIQHAKAGPPISVGGYNNNVQLFQAPGYVALLNEQNHDVRIIPLDGRPHVGSQISQWMGDSRGHWEGDTLVVETVQFNGKHDQIGRPLRSTGQNLSLVERFTRTDADTLHYEFVVTDPTIWVNSWTVALPMKRNPALIYEFACHEGNYGLYNIMAGSRMEELAESAPR